MAELAGPSVSARSIRSDVIANRTHPAAGCLVFGDMGRPKHGTGVLERVMRKMNRRTDVGVRWSVPGGVRAILMVELQRKYAHGPWSPTPAADQTPAVRFSFVA